MRLGPVWLPTNSPVVRCSPCPGQGVCTPEPGPLFPVASGGLQPGLLPRSPAGGSIAPRLPLGGAVGPAWEVGSAVPSVCLCRPRAPLLAWRPASSSARLLAPATNLLLPLPVCYMEALQRALHPVHQLPICEMEITAQCHRVWPRPGAEKWAGDVLTSTMAFLRE